MVIIYVNSIKDERGKNQDKELILSAAFSIIIMIVFVFNSSIYMAINSVILIKQYYSNN